MTGIDYPVCGSRITFTSTSFTPASFRHHSLRLFLEYHLPPIIKGSWSTGFLDYIPPENSRVFPEMLGDACKNKTSFL